MVTRASFILGMPTKALLEVQRLRRRHRGIEHGIGILVQAHGEQKFRHSRVLEKIGNPEQQMLEHAVCFFTRAVVMKGL